MSKLIDFQNVSISFGSSPVIHDVSFSVGEGEILGLIGESGSGKTTLLRSGVGLLARDARASGSVTFEGKNLLTAREEELRQVRGRKIGMVFQDSGTSLCPIRTIGETVYESLAAHEQVTESEARARALALFTRLRFEDGERVLSSYPFELSGGMCQRVGIALSLLLRPRLLLADEPTSALDALAARRTIELLKRARETGMGIIVVTHDFGVVRALTDNVLVLQKGGAVEYGRTEDVLRHPRQPYTQRIIAAVPTLRRAV